MIFFRNTMTKTAYMTPRTYPGNHQGVISTPKSQTQDFRENDTQLYFARFSVFVESKEIFQKFHS